MNISSRTKKIIRWVIVCGIFFYFAVRIFHTVQLFFTEFNDHRWFSLMSPDEQAAFSQIKQLYEKRDKSSVLRLVAIAPKEVDFEVIPAKPLFAQPEAKLGAIRLTNTSSHRLIVFTPRLTKLTRESYQHDGYIQDDFMLDCSPSDKYHCHILEPSKTVFFPIILGVDGAGKHKLNFNLMTPTSTGGTTIARSEPTFEIAE